MSRIKFLQVENVRNLVQALSALRSRDPGVPGLAVVHGPPGRGKTQAAIWYAANKGGRYIEANPAWTVRWMLNDLYLLGKGLRQGPRIHRVDQAYELAVGVLEQVPLPILIDEGDRLCRDIRLLEMIRHLHDRTGVPIVFIGTDIITGKLAQHDRFWRRVMQVVPFNPLGLAEIRLAARELAGLELPAEALEMLHRHTKGEFGSVVKVLPKLSRALRAGERGKVAPELVDRVCTRALRRAA